MNDLIPIAVVLAIVLAGAVATAVLGYRRSAFAPRIAKISRASAVVVVVWGVLGTVSGIVKTVGAIGAPGLSPADRQAILSNGVAEALWSIVVFAPAALPSLLIAQLVLRRQKPL